MMEVNNSINQINKSTNTINKTKLDNYHLQIALDSLFNNKDISKENFINILDILLNHSRRKLNKIISEKELELEQLKSNNTSKERIEQLEQQIKDLENTAKTKIEIPQNYNNDFFNYDITEDNKLLITFKWKNLFDSFNYDSFIEAIKEIAKDFNGVEINFENCVVEQKIFDKVIKKERNTIELKTLNYNVDNNKEINLHFSNMRLQNVDLTNYTISNLENLRNNEILSENYLFKGCQFSFNTLSEIINNFRNHIKFFEKDKLEFFRFLNFKNLDFEQLEYIDNNTKDLVQIINGKYLDLDKLKSSEYYTQKIIGIDKFVSFEPIEIKK